MSPEWLTLMEWTAASATFLGVWWIGSKSHLTRLRGWVVGLIGVIWWVTYALYTGQWGLLTLNLFFVVSYVRGFLNER